MLRFVTASPVALLTLLNLLVFITINIIARLADSNFITALAVPAGFGNLLHRLWTVVTYMFVHVDIIELIFNMLWLWAFGTIVARTEGKRQVWLTYIVAGVSGSLFFEFVAQTNGFLIGASASVIGLIVFAGVCQPRLRLNLFLFGNVELKWVALAAFVLCGIIPGVGRTPTLFAHLGGALAGLALGLFYSAQKNKPKVRTTNYRRPSGNIRIDRVRLHQQHGLAENEQMELDSLLEKVGRSGYSSLSSAEQKRLFTLSEKMKRFK